MLDSSHEPSVPQVPRSRVGSYRQGCLEMSSLRREFRCAGSNARLSRSRGPCRSGRRWTGWPLSTGSIDHEPRRDRHGKRPAERAPRTVQFVSECLVRRGGMVCSGGAGTPGPSRRVLDRRVAHRAAKTSDRSALRRTAAGRVRAGSLRGVEGNRAAAARL